MAIELQIKRIDDPRWVEFLYELCGRHDDFFDRRVVVTPYSNGCDIEGFAVAVAGTPARALAFVPANETGVILIWPSARVKVLPGTDDHDRLRGFLRRHEFILSE